MSCGICERAPLTSRYGSHVCRNEPGNEPVRSTTPRRSEIRLRPEPTVDGRNRAVRWQMLDGRPYFLPY